MGQANSPANSTTALFTIPGGLCNVTFYNLSAVNIYIGTTNRVTATSGLQCHSIPTSFFSYVGSPGATFYGANTSATTVQVNYIISSGF